MTVLRSNALFNVFRKSEKISYFSHCWVEFYYKFHLCRPKANSNVINISPIFIIYRFGQRCVNRKKACPIRHIGHCAQYRTYQMRKMAESHASNCQIQKKNKQIIKPEKMMPKFYVNYRKFQVMRASTLILPLSITVENIHNCIFRLANTIYFNKSTFSGSNRSLWGLKSLRIDALLHLCLMYLFHCRSLYLKWFGRSHI